MKLVNQKAKPVKSWLTLLSILVLSACAIDPGYVRGVSQPDTRNPCGEGRIRLFVVDQEGGDLGGVTISAVSSAGIVELGVTDSLQADICIDNEVLLDPKVNCILFCRDGYFCGALLPRPELAGYWELMMALARRVVS